MSKGLLAVVLLMSTSIAFVQQERVSNVRVFVTSKTGIPLTDSIVSITRTNFSATLTKGSTPGEYQLAGIPLGEYSLRASLSPDFEPSMKGITIDESDSWFTIALGLVAVELPKMTREVLGHVVFQSGEPTPRWVRIASLYGTEIQESLVKADGTFRFGKVSDTAYIMWILAGSRTCDVRRIDFKDRTSRIDIGMTRCSER